MTPEDVAAHNPVGLVAAVWRYKWLTLGLAAVAAVAALLFTLSSSNTVKAKATVALTDPRGNTIFRQGSSANIDVTRYTAERAAFAESAQVLGRAAEKVGDGATAESVNEQVEVKPDPATSILSIVAEASTASEAEKVADAVAEAYEELSLDETKQKAELALNGLTAQREEALAIIRSSASTSAEVAAGTQTLSSVNARAAEIESAAELFGAGVSFVDPARPVKSGGMTELLRNTVAGGMIGLVVGAALAWVLADRRQREAAEAADAGDDSEDEAEPPGDDEHRTRSANGSPRGRGQRQAATSSPRRPRRPETLL